MLVDVVVVGGSFAGLAAATSIGRMLRSVLVIDNGKNRNRFAKEVHNFVGFEGQSPAAVLEKARETTFKYPDVKSLQGTVTKIQNLSTEQTLKFKLTVETAEGVQEVECSRVILACGVVDELPAIEGLKELWGGEGVAHCPHCHGYEVRGKKLGFVYAPHPMLPAYSKMLKQLSKQDLTMFLNGATLEEKDQGMWAALGVTVEAKKISKLIPLDDQKHDRGLQAVSLEDGSNTPLDCLFTITGASANATFTEQLGLELDNSMSGKIYKTNPMTKETSVKGVYACGDTARVSHQVTMAIADGLNAGIMCDFSLM
jgi:thioredoxin reductase